MRVSASSELERDGMQQSAPAHGEQKLDRTCMDEGCLTY